jgi:hypothetical protein
MEDTTAGKMVAAYIKLRSAIQEKEDEIKALKEKQALVSASMLDLCSKEDIDSIKTPFGTLTRRIYSSYWTSDWTKCISSSQKTMLIIY